MATSIGFAKALTRLGNFALDDSSVFTNVVDLNNYLNSGTCYAGQTLALVDTTTGSAKIYKVEGKVVPFTITQIDSASISLDNVSLDNNTSSKLELKGFETANNDTVIMKGATGIEYKDTQKSSTNAGTKLAFKEYIDEVAQGSIILQNVSYDASTNTPDITVILTTSQAKAWHISVAGTQTLGGTSYTFRVNDWVVKTIGGGYLKIDNSSVSTVWGSLGGNIVDQTDLKTELDKKSDKVVGATKDDIAILDVNGNLVDSGKKISDLVLNTTTVNGHALNSNVTLTNTDVGLGNVQNVDTTNASNISSGTLPSARLPLADATNIGGVKQGTGVKIGVDGTIEADIIDDTITTSTTETYSIDKIIALLNNKQNKITISNVAPTSPQTNDLWIDTTNASQYVLKCFNLTWITVGSTSSGSGVKIWTNGSKYDTNDLVVFSSNLYLTLNNIASSTSDPSVDTTNFKIVGGSGSNITASNIGTTKKVFKQKTGDNLEFRTLTEGTNINIVQSGDSLVISSNLTGNADNSIDYKDTLTSDFTYDNTKIDFDSTSAKLYSPTSIDSQAKLVMHMENLTKDDLGHVITNNGATLDTTNYKIGTSSASFNGTSNYISIAKGSDFNIGTNDFTISFYTKTSTYVVNSGYYRRFFTLGGTDSANTIQMMFYGSNKVTVYSNEIAITGATSIADEVWHHIELSRASGTLRLFVDGVLDGSATFNNSLTAGTNYNPAIGCYGDFTGGYFQGNIDEFILLNGKALHTANFTPSTIRYGTNYDTSGYNTISLQSSKLLDASDWYQVNGISIVQNAPTNTDIKWLLDVGGTYKKWDSANKVWVDVLLADIGTQGNTKAELEACFTNYSWSSTGFTKFGLVCALKSNDASITPTVDKVDINFLKGQNTLAGHVIESDTQTMSQRSILHFKNATITDDSTNGKTIIEYSGGSIALSADEW